MPLIFIAKNGRPKQLRESGAYTLQFGFAIASLMPGNRYPASREDSRVLKSRA